MARRYKITKATYEKLVGVIFEYAIINDVKAPKWFQEFVEKRFDPEITNIKARLEKVESEIVGIKTDIVTINDILKRNNLR
ncbi:MAG: hypothetical protein LBG49_01655 [Mycoplasmataceae bacterium]|jgi:CBS domain-containing protein|nr:hypothetical protein [Mycoplasmataceae bacterium]